MMRKRREGLREDSLLRDLRRPLLTSKCGSKVGRAWTKLCVHLHTTVDIEGGSGGFPPPWTPPLLPSLSTSLSVWGCKFNVQIFLVGDSCGDGDHKYDHIYIDKLSMTLDKYDHIYIDNWVNGDDDYQVNVVYFQYCLPNVNKTRIYFNKCHCLNRTKLILIRLKKGQY